MDVTSSSGTAWACLLHNIVIAILESRGKQPQPFASLNNECPGMKNPSPAGSGTLKGATNRSVSTQVFLLQRITLIVIASEAKQSQLSRALRLPRPFGPRNDNCGPFQLRKRLF